MREPTVVLCHSTRSWAQDLHFFLMDHGGAVVRGYVMSGEDALAESYDVLLVDDVTSFLTRRLVGSLQGRSVKIVGVFDADDAHGAGKARLLELGVDEAVPSTTVPAEFVQVVARLAGPLIDDDLELAGILEEVGSRQQRRGATGAMGRGGRHGIFAAASLRGLARSRRVPLPDRPARPRALCRGFAVRAAAGGSGDHRGLCSGRPRALQRARDRALRCGRARRDSGRCIPAGGRAPRNPPDTAGARAALRLFPVHIHRCAMSGAPEDA